VRSLLVTGAAGFIGSNFVRRALAAEPDARVTSLDNLGWAGRRENLDDLPDPARHELIVGDIRDGALVRRLMRARRVDAVVNFAAETHVDRSIHDPAAFVGANVEGTLSLLEAARAVWAEAPPDAPTRFHQVGTDEVYGDLAPDAPPSREGDPYLPSSPYAASKAGADHLALAWARTYSMPVSLHLASNTYGPRQLPEKLIPAFIARALGGEPLPIYGDGLQTRDWLYVDDHCDAILAVLRRGRPGRVYHVGGGGGADLSNNALVDRLCALLDEALPASPHVPHVGLVRRVADRPGHDRRYALDCARARDELGWRPEVALREGLRLTVRWYLGARDRLALTRGAWAWRAWEGLQYGDR